ncbi:MAG: tRNA (N(6)-L-threonylcarbamoyladenosine(37)-C(2))-methylthiotransferase MtaB [Bacteroidaceae bacterium]|nr:tRNA (N(6)-L-threonylcarbamoyladenosine(37)-C(2))-methylthiotransferase MtaB [Bacteroidaceae bacterium]
MLKAAYYTLGCKLNFAETSAFGLLLQEAGIRRAQRGERADVCIINTCTVTEMANSKGRQLIHRVIKENPGAFVAVTGCYAQMRPEDIRAIPGVGLIVGAQQKDEFIPRVKEALGLGSRSGADTADAHSASSPSFFPACSRGDRTRYYLKVQDGCDNFCTYCTVPYARGRSRNGSVESIIDEAREVAAEGGKEIVITGVNTGDFGRTTGESFLELLQRLDEVEGIERYRISSIEPNLLTDEIIDFCARSRAFMPHFHIPLQSGSDEVLRLMHRRYTTDFFRSKIDRVNDAIPDCFIGVDVIVGMRGETDECFEQSYHFMERLDVSQFHVFSYSERPGTKALAIPHKVPPQVRHERSQRVIALSGKKTHDFYSRFIGTSRPVLLEHAKRQKPMNGFTDNYIRVEYPDTPSLDNHIVTLRLTGFNDTGDALTASEP